MMFVSSLIELMWNVDKIFESYWDRKEKEGKCASNMCLISVLRPQ